MMFAQSRPRRAESSDAGSSQSSVSPRRNTQTEEKPQVSRRRPVQTNEEFEVTSLKVTGSSAGKISMDISFTKGVDPETVNSRTIVIDGLPSRAEKNYTFSKKGNTLRITFSAPEGSFSVRIDNVYSADGDRIRSVNFENVCDGYSYSGQ